MLAKNSTCVYPQYSNTNNSSNDTDNNDPTRSNVYKFNGNVVYEYLIFPTIPFELDYVSHSSHHHHFHHYYYRLK